MEEQIKIFIMNLKKLVENAEEKGFQDELIRITQYFDSLKDEDKIYFVQSISPSIKELGEELSNKMDTIEDIRLGDYKRNWAINKYSQY